MMKISQSARENLAGYYQKREFGIKTDLPTVGSLRGSQFPLRERDKRAKLKPSPH